jgi:putative transposase
MARLARIVVPGGPHLVRQGSRGDRPVFRDRRDRESYLALLADALDRHRVGCLAYRLRPDEAMMVLVPPTEAGLCEALRLAHGRYSRRVNRDLSRTGSLFAGRFQSCPVDPKQLAVGVRYLESHAGRPPPRTECSALYRAGRHRGPLAPLSPWLEDRGIELRRPPDPAEVAYLLGRLRVGKPAGGAEFVRGIEQRTGLDLIRPPGRPTEASPGPSAPASAV